MSKLDYVLNTLKKWIKGDKWIPGQKIPSVRSLAHEFNVSLATVQRAVSRLAEENLVNVTKGSGIYIAGEYEPAIDFRKDTSTKSGAVAEEMIQDIVQGRTRTGDILPAPKVLQYQYNVSFVTVKAALKQVEVKGLIHRLGRNYVAGPARIARSSFGGRPVFAVGTRQQYNRYAAETVTREFIRPFEQELNKYGIPGIELLDITDGTGRIVNILAKKEALGFFHLGIVFRPRATWEQMTREFQLLANQPAPCFVYATHLFENLIPDYKIKPGRSLYLHYMSERDLGVSVGTYLASMGHRNIAYFSYFDDAEYAVNRFSNTQLGLKKIFGNQYRMTFFKGRSRYRKLKEERKETLEMVEKMCGIYPFRYMNIRSQIRASVQYNIAEDESRRYMEPIFRAALNQKQYTVWLCSDENLAVAAMEFLRREGVRVPEEISLMGIENEKHAFINRITTYDYEKIQISYLAAHAILGDIPVKRKRNGVIDCPGRIVERGSVSRL